MYCPRCSQEQVSEGVRFCPRCGFQLDAVQSLLAGDGSPAAAAQVEPRARLAPASKRDFLLGATLMLAGAVCVALLTVSSAAGTPLQAVLIPLLLAWAALVSVLLLSGHAVREVARLFSGEASAPPAADSPGLTKRLGAARRQALPHAQTAPASGLGSRRTNTAELVQPPSVTERTTGLLDEG